MDKNLRDDKEYFRRLASDSIREAMSIKVQRDDVIRVFEHIEESCIELKAERDRAKRLLIRWQEWWIKRFGAIETFGGDGTYDAGQHDCSAPISDATVTYLKGESNGR